MSNLEKAMQMLEESRCSDMEWANELVRYYGNTAERANDLQFDFYRMLLFCYFAGVIDGRSGANGREHR
jgi:hypothetical protein